MIAPLLNTQPFGFDLENARACLMASSAAYGKEITICDKETDTQVLILEPAQPGAPIVIAFRGSESLGVWLTDVNCWQVTDEVIGRVHRGFWEAWGSVRERVFARLDEWGANTPIFVTGHSLGGALAMLAARSIDWMVGRYDVHSVYTFGQPRVGDKYFASRYDSALKGRTFRVVNDMDVVPRLPMLGALVGTYRHAGQLVHLEERKDYSTPIPRKYCEIVTDPSLTRMLARDAFVFARSKWKGLAEALEDHLMLAYMGALGVSHGLPNSDCRLQIAESNAEVGA